MDEKMLSQARERLLKMRQEVLKEVAQSSAASQEMGQDGVPDIGDMASNINTRDILYNLNETQRRKLRDIEAALQKIDEGEYGICQRCEEEIPPRRMEVRPFSRFCVDCKAEVEKFGE